MSLVEQKRSSAYIKFIGCANKEGVSVITARHRLNASAAVAKSNKQRSMQLISNTTFDGSAGMYWGGLGQQQVAEINRTARKR